MKIWPRAVTDDRKALADQAVAYRKLGIVMMKSRPTVSAHCCAGCANLRISSTSFRGCARSHRPMAVAFNATCRIRGQQGGGGDGPRQACRALRLCFY